MAQNFLKDATHAGLYYLPASRQRQFREMAGKAHLQLLGAELDAGAGLGQILAELGEALHFPIWYGANLDALHDCLTDPDWQRGRGIAIQISGLDGLRQHDPQAFSTLIEVLASAARERSAEKHPLWVLLGTPARGIAVLPEA